MNELAIQTQLVDAALEEDGFAFKQKNMFVKGIADLYVKLLALPDVHIEVKFAKKFNTRGEAKAELTAHQCRFLHSVQKAEGHAGYCFVVGMGRGAYAIWAHRYLHDGADGRYGALSLTAGRHDGGYLVKARGGNWPIEEIVKACLS